MLLPKKTTRSPLWKGEGVFCALPHTNTESIHAKLKSHRLVLILFTFGHLEVQLFIRYGHSHEWISTAIIQNTIYSGNRPDLPRIRYPQGIDRFFQNHPSVARKAYPNDRSILSGYLHRTMLVRHNKSSQDKRYPLFLPVRFYLSLIHIWRCRRAI